MATEMTLAITLKSDPYVASHSDQPITPVTQTYVVPISTNGRNGIKERINQLNEAIKTSDITAESGVALYGRALQQSTIYTKEGLENYNVGRARIAEISAAKITMVETETVYDYSNA